jgi:hypothetical protein
MGTLMMRKGGCFCGAVAGEPEAMGYCLCQSCRSCSGGPVNAFTLGRWGDRTPSRSRQYCGPIKIPTSAIYAENLE